MVVGVKGHFSVHLINALFASLRVLDDPAVVRGANFSREFVAKCHLKQGERKHVQCVT
jgi:hypothetical protein